jgi:hypothetical protein
MTRVVTTHCRYKRPRRRKQAVALEVPEVVKAADPAKVHTSVRPAPKTPPPAIDDGPAEPASRDAARKPAIVTARKPGARYATVPDMTPEEHRRRGDAAQALWRGLMRRATGKERP